MTRGKTARCALGVLLVAGLSLASPVAFAASEGPPVASGRDDDPLSGISFALDVSGDEAKAAAAVSGYLSPRPADQDSEGPRNDISWKLNVAVPVGGNDSVLDRATLEKLGDGTEIGASINLLHYTVDLSRFGSPEFLALMHTARKQCASEAADPGARSACLSAFPDEDFVREHTPWARVEMNRVLYLGFWSLGAKGAVSINRYSYVTAGTLAEIKAHPTGYSGTIWGVYHPSDAVSAWKLEAEYSDAPEASDEEVICKTVIVVPKDDCVKASPSSPTRSEALVIRGEYRRYFPFRSGKGGIGMALTGSVDTLSGDYGAELPIFLTLPGTSAVAPGVKLGYSSEEDDVSLSLFIKTGFSF